MVYPSHNKTIIFPVPFQNIIYINKHLFLRPSLIHQLLSNQSCGDHSLEASATDLPAVECLAVLDNLDDHTLNLLEVLDIDISPQHNCENSDGQNGGRGDKHRLLGVTVRLVNSSTGWCTHSVPLLHLNTSKDSREVRLALLRQVGHKFTRHNARPNCSSDRRTNGTSNGREHTLNSEDNGNILMGRNGQSSDLLGDNEGSSREGIEDLTHDYVSDINIWLTELDHKRNSKNREWDTEVQRDRLVAAGVTDNEPNDDGPEAGADRVDVGDVAGGGELEVVDDLEHGCEVGVPDVEADEQSRSQDTGAEDGSVQEEVVWDVGDWGEETLPYGEEDDHDAADGDHGDDEWLFPSVWLVVVDGEWKQEQSKSSSNEKESDKIELNTPMHNSLLPCAAGGLALGDETRLLGLTLVLEEEEEEWEADNRSNDGEGSVAPSPAWTFEEGLRERTGDPDGGDVDAGGEREHETSVAELGGIGDEDTEDVDCSSISG